MAMLPVLPSRSVYACEAKRMSRSELLRARLVGRLSEVEAAVDPDRLAR